jgi:multimeric flavodoxin WrbA
MDAGPPHTTPAGIPRWGACSISASSKGHPQSFRVWANYHSDSTLIWRARGGTAVASNQAVSSVILSAAGAEQPSLRALSTTLLEGLARIGETDVRNFELPEMPLAYCQGEFDCWVKTPGVCRSRDAEQEIVQAIVGATRVIYLDAVTFGGHSYTTKRAQDRLLCLLTPFFEKRLSLTHHGYRYEHPPSFHALGWLPKADPEQARTWCELADANAVNMLAPKVGAAVVHDGAPGAWSDVVQSVLLSSREPGSGIRGRRSLREALLTAARPEDGSFSAEPVRRAALLVGSAKTTGTSASERLAEALRMRLQTESVEVETLFAKQFVHERDSAQQVAEQVAQADLFVLVTPLYVDALPALATHALQMVAAARNRSTPARFSMLINCGFPEPEHTRTALRIARHFAGAAGYHWMGGLPLGGGGVIDPGTPLEQQGGPVEHVKRALDLAAPALVGEAGLPDDAVLEMSRSPMPDVLYRIMGDVGFRYQVHKNGLAQRRIWDKPFDAD